MGKQIQKYSLQEQLGSGVYSRVFKAVHLITKQEVAIKMVKANKFKEMPKLQEGTINQINTLTSLKPCPNIIRYFDMLKTVNHFYFVYEYCNGGTLQKVIKAQKVLGEKQSLLYFKQLTSAFKVLAENHIMHRDIKPENILIHNGTLKVADFGFCKPLEHQDGMAETMLGSPVYMAPEVLKGQAYTIKADVWSLGVVLYRMIFGFCPFESSNIGKLILMLNENDLKIPNHPSISPALEELLRRMLTKNEKNRADWHQVFCYEITDNGEIYDIRQPHKFETPKTSTTASMNSNKSPIIGQEPNGHMQRIRRVESPQHNDSKCDKKFHKMNNLFVKQPSLRETFKSKSPIKVTTHSRSSKKQGHIKNHKKCVELTSLVIEIMHYHSIESISLGYILCKNIEKQLLALKGSVNRQFCSIPLNASSRGQNQFLQQMRYNINEELKNLNHLIFEFENILYDEDMRPSEIFDNSKKVLKDFILSIEDLGQNKQKKELLLCHQLVDYMLDEIMINKKTYEKLSCEQMHKKIKDKLNQITE